MRPGGGAGVLGRAQAGGVRAVALFAGSYLAVWALAGFAVYALYRPHGSAAAGAVVIAAGVYRLTPAKRHFPRPSPGSAPPGFALRLFCAASSIALIPMLAPLPPLRLPSLPAIPPLLP